MDIPVHTLKQTAGTKKNVGLETVSPFPFVGRYFQVPRLF